jgi:iron complex transport system substrate-binding protein
MLNKSLVVAGSVAAALAATAVKAEPTSYPLTIENCGQSVTFEQAPQNAVALGQNSAEIMLLLGLEDRMAATAFWPNKVLDELEEANDKVEVLTVEFPTLEAVLSKQPDFVAAMLTTLLGPDSKVAKRGDFETLGIPTYLSPSACSTALDTDDAYGSREDLWSVDLLYKEIEDISRIFDVADRGAALIEDFKAREAALREQFSGQKDLTFLFWFSSPSPADDAYLGGGNGPSGYIADLLGGLNAVETEAECRSKTTWACPARWPDCPTGEGRLAVRSCYWPRTAAIVPNGLQERIRGKKPVSLHRSFKEAERRAR